MPDLLWRIVEHRLHRDVPPAHRDSTLGDLAEDYALRRDASGAFRARVWLLREAWSLARAYRRAAALNARPSGLMLANDVRHAWLRLRARPGAALICVALLALGIGLSTGMFSVIDALLLRPAPFRDGDRLVQQTLPPSVSLPPASSAILDAWRTNGMFTAVETGRVHSFQWRTESGTTSTWSGASITPGVFELLGVSPIRGRGFSPSGDADEVVLSELIWRSAFGADPYLIGRRIRLDDTSAIVVGIMPASFRFPIPTTIVWRPLDESSREPSVFTVFGRLAPDVPVAAAQVEMAALAGQYLPRWLAGPPVRGVGDPSLNGFTRQALWLLLGGVALVFLVLCANVSSLLLANLSSRRRELALCSALGASRTRLVRETTAEHALIGIAGAVAGVCVAWAFTSIVPHVFRDHTLNLIDIDVRALAAAATLGLTSVVLTGLIPAWIATNSDAIESMRGSQQSGTETRGARALARSLVVAEVAFACSLLVGSTFLARSFANLMNADRGLKGDDVVRVSVGGLDDAFGSYAAIAIAIAAIEERFTAWPEISAVALSREIPPAGARPAQVHLGVPGVAPDPDATIASDMYRVSPAFFDLYGIPILRGRPLALGDTERDVVVGKRLADRLWPSEDPLGRTFAMGRAATHRVVGVAGEIELPTIDPSLNLPEFYTPMGAESRTLFVNFRCRARCPHEAAIREQIQTVHPALRARLASPATDGYMTQLRLPRATAEAGGLFAIVAVLTAGGGLFSVLTYAVGRRRREFGIRTALGASPSQVQRLVFQEAAAVVAIGVAAGVGGGWLVTRSLTAFFYGVTTSDPVTWVGVLGTIAVTSLAAAWRPALQAMRFDPMTLLRDE